MVSSESYPRKSYFLSVLAGVRDRIERIRAVINAYSRRD